MKKRLLALFLLISILLTGCTLPGSETTGPAPGGDYLRVHYIDVGQADCALLECGGEFMLIDGGNPEDSSLVVSYLLNQGVEELKMVVGTHPHSDHIGGLAGVLAVFPTKMVMSPTTTYGSKAFDNFMYYTDQQRLEVTIPSVGDTYTLGSATVTVLGPVKDSYEDVNDTSLVLMVQLGDNRFLFTGDMESQAERDLLEAGTDLKADVLKVGHHGSHSSTGYRFLREVAPTYGIISCGRGNSYGHPHEEPLSRLKDADVTVYRTDQMGSIVAFTDGQNITFTWEKSKAVPSGIKAYIPNFRCFV